MLSICGRRSVVPLVHVYGTGAHALEVEIWMILFVWVPCWETIIASRAMKHDHVTQHTLSVEHAPQKLLSELRVHFSCPHRYVICTTNGYAGWESRRLAPLTMRGSDGF